MGEPIPLSLASDPNLLTMKEEIREEEGRRSLPSPELSELEPKRNSASDDSPSSRRNSEGQSPALSSRRMSSNDPSSSSKQDILDSGISAVKESKRTSTDFNPASSSPKRNSRDLNKAPDTFQPNSQDSGSEPLKRYSDTISVPRRRSTGPIQGERKESIKSTSPLSSPPIFPMSDTMGGNVAQPSGGDSLPKALSNLAILDPELIAIALPIEETDSFSAPKPRRVTIKDDNPKSQGQNLQLSDITSPIRGELRTRLASDTRPRKLSNEVPKKMEGLDQNELMQKIPKDSIEVEKQRRKSTLKGNGNGIPPYAILPLPPTTIIAMPVAVSTSKPKVELPSDNSQTDLKQNSGNIKRKESPPPSKLRGSKKQNLLENPAPLRTSSQFPEIDFHDESNSSSGGKRPSFDEKDNAAKGFYAKITLIEPPKLSTGEVGPLSEETVETYLKTNPAFLNKYISKNCDMETLQVWMGQRLNTIPFSNPTSARRMDQQRLMSQGGYTIPPPGGIEQQRLMSQGGYSFPPGTPGMMSQGQYPEPELTIMPSGMRCKLPKGMRIEKCGLSRLMNYFHEGSQFIDWSGGLASPGCRNFQRTEPQIRKPVTNHPTQAQLRKTLKFGQPNLNGNNRTMAAQQDCSYPRPNAAMNLQQYRNL